MNFLDYFSAQSGDYVKFRPRYPEALFAYLANLTAEHQIAWDGGTGNGQVALSLTEYFEQIYATDPSEKQIANAFQHDRIRYSIAKAENTQIPNSSVDLVTIAQALHWFNLEQFYQEAKRVLKPKGVIAVWCYDLFTVPDADEQLNKALQNYYQAVEPFWPPERQLVEEKYQTIPFPFNEITPPPFSMTVEWNAQQVIGYLSTWSATQRFIAQYDLNQIKKLSDSIINAWISPSETKIISWHLYLKVGTFS